MGHRTFDGDEALGIDGRECYQAFQFVQRNIILDILQLLRTIVRAGAIGGESWSLLSKSLSPTIVFFGTLCSCSREFRPLGCEVETVIRVKELSLGC